jgi:hypothetical protein
VETAYRRAARVPERFYLSRLSRQSIILTSVQVLCGKTSGMYIYGWLGLISTSDTDETSVNRHSPTRLQSSIASPGYMEAPPCIYSGRVVAVSQAPPCIYSGRVVAVSPWTLSRNSTASLSTTLLRRPSSQSGADRSCRLLGIGEMMRGLERKILKVYRLATAFAC